MARRWGGRSSRARESAQTMAKQKTSSLAAPPELLARLDAALKRRFGTNAHYDNVKATTLGGSNRTLLFDLVEGTARRRLVFRQETYRLAHSPFISPHQQYQMLLLAQEHALPIPSPVFEFEPEDELDRGYVVMFVDGETLPRRLLSDAAFADARARFPHTAADILARLHRIPVTRASFLEDVPDTLDPIAAQLERYASYGEAHPAIDFAVRWLQQHRPPATDRCVLHGDFRTGNLMMGPEGVRALLDWECAHLGDPMEELAWLCLRNFRFGVNEREVGGFCAREPFYTAYEAASGRVVEPKVVRWWEIFGHVRWAVLNIMQAHGHWTGARRSPAFAACGRNVCLIEYEMLMTLQGSYT